MKHAGYQIEGITEDISNAAGIDVSSGAVDIINNLDVRNGSSNESPLGVCCMCDSRSLHDTIIMQTVSIYDTRLYMNGTSQFSINLLQYQEENNDNENSDY